MQDQLIIFASGNSMGQLMLLTNCEQVTRRRPMVEKVKKFAFCLWPSKMSWEMDSRNQRLAPAIWHCSIEIILEV